jgi:hypothetical protein
LQASRIGLAKVAPPPTRFTAYAGAATKEKTAATTEIFIKNLRTNLVSFMSDWLLAVEQYGSDENNCSTKDKRISNVK